MFEYCKKMKSIENIIKYRFSCMKRELFDYLKFIFENILIS